MEPSESTEDLEHPTQIAASEGILGKETKNEELLKGIVAIFGPSQLSAVGIFLRNPDDELCGSATLTDNAALMRTFRDTLLALFRAN